MDSIAPEGEDQKERVRSIAASRLQELCDEVAALPQNHQAPLPTSWVHPEPNGMDTRSDAALFFDSTGFLHVPSFVSLDVAQSMKEEMARRVETEWDPSADALDSFGTDAAQNLARGRYFLESAARVHFFAEPAALNAQQQLNEAYRSAKLRALNKVGHALHTLPDSAFARYTQSEAVRNLVRDLGWRDPVVPQSMYIFKHPDLGGVVNSHQDSTFLYTTPRPTCLGLWLALDDATIENGCLWVRPKSHVATTPNRMEHYNVRRQYQRNVLYFGEASIAARSNVAGGDMDQQPMFEMRTLYKDPDVPWDGALPGDDWDALLQAGFVPVECRAGDVLVFAGTLDHLSLPNRTATASRDTFQLHLVEGPSQGVEWSPLNWLQYPAEQSFVRLNAIEATK